jgi:hypothetical protein
MTDSPAHARAEAAGRNIAVDVTTATVVRALAEAGVPSIVLKGPPQTRWLYGDDLTRFSVDVDLLVAPEAFAHAEAVLAELGFEGRSLGGIPHDRPWITHEWFGGPSGVGVDLHRNLTGANASAEDVWRILKARTETVGVRGVTIEVLGPAARALHVALHAAQHGAREPKPVADLRRALEVVPLETWRRAAALAHDLDAIAAFVAGVEVTAEGEKLVAQLSLPRRTTVEAALRASTPPRTAVGFDWLARVPGARAKASLVFRKVFPPRAWLRSWSPLAAKGRWGLAIAYIWRPLWLLAHVGPGFLAWRRVRKAHARASESSARRS